MQIKAPYTQYMYIKDLVAYCNFTVVYNRSQMLNTSVRILFIATRHQYIFFCKYHARNIVWNWYGRLSFIPFWYSSIPFWHLPSSTQEFHLFHTILCLRLRHKNRLLANDDNGEDSDAY